MNMLITNISNHVSCSQNSADETGSSSFQSWKKKKTRLYLNRSVPLTLPKQVNSFDFT